jgi:hypothetical protein
MTNVASTTTSRHDQCHLGSAITSMTRQCHRQHDLATILHHDQVTSSATLRHD